MEEHRAAIGRLVSRHRARQRNRAVVDIDRAAGGRPVAGHGSVDGDSAAGDVDRAAVGTPGVAKGRVRLDLQRRVCIVEDHRVRRGYLVAVDGDPVKLECAIVGEHVARRKAGLALDDGGAVHSRGEGDVIAAGDGQRVVGGLEITVDKHLNGTHRRAAVLDMLQRGVQGIEGLRSHLADEGGHVEQHQLVVPVKAGVTGVTFKICPRRVLPRPVRIADRRDIRSHGSAAVVHRGVLVLIILLVRPGEAGSGVQVVREIAVDPLIREFAFIPRNAGIAHGLHHPGAVLVRLAIIRLPEGRPGLYGQGDAVMGIGNGAAVLHAGDDHRRTIGVTAAPGDTRGIVGIFGILRDRQLRPGGNRQRFAVRFAIGQRKGHLAVHKPVGGVVLLADGRRVQCSLVAVFGVIPVVHLVAVHLVDHHIVAGQYGENARPVGDGIVLLISRRARRRDGIGAWRLARRAGHCKNQLRFLRSLAGIGPSIAVQLRDKRLVALGECVQLQGEVRVRMRVFRVIELQGVVRRNGQAGLGDRQPAVDIGHLIVPLDRIADGADPVGVRVLALFPLEGVFDGVIPSQARNGGGKRRVGIAIGLVGVVHPHHDLGAGDGKGSRRIAHVIVALFRRAGHGDGIGAHIFASLAADGVVDHRWRVVVFQPCHGGGQLRVVLAVGLTGVVRGHGDRRGGDFQGAVGKAHLVVALDLGGACHGDDIAAHPLADLAPRIVGDQAFGLAVLQARDGDQLFGVGITVDLGRPACHCNRRTGDGEGRGVIADAIARLRFTASRLDGVFAHVLTLGTGTGEGQRLNHAFVIRDGDGIVALAVRAGHV